MQFVELTEEEFDQRFKPIPNPRDGGFYYDTPEDEDLIKTAAEERRLFTAVDGDNGETLLYSGWHLVNRFAYVITENAWEPDIEYYVELIGAEDYCPTCGDLLASAGEDCTNTKCGEDA